MPLYFSKHPNNIVRPGDGLGVSDQRRECGRRHGRRRWQRRRAGGGGGRSHLLLFAGGRAAERAAHSCREENCRHIHFSYVRGELLVGFVAEI